MLFAKDAFRRLGRNLNRYHGQFLLSNRATGSTLATAFSAERTTAHPETSNDIRRSPNDDQKKPRLIYLKKSDELEIWRQYIRSCVSKSERLGGLVDRRSQ